jgi:hypothetical protein
MVTFMHEAFAFTDAGRTFTCRVEPMRAQRNESWWWFHVSTEANERYAPFRAAETDTSEAVRDRVLAFYDNLLARRAEPYQRHWTRGRPAAPAAAAAAPTAAPE